MSKKGETGKHVSQKAVNRSCEEQIRVQAGTEEQGADREVNSHDHEQERVGFGAGCILHGLEKLKPFMGKLRTQRFAALKDRALHPQPVLIPYTEIVL